MEQKPKLAQYKKDILICFILIVFTCLIFLPFLQGHYIPDTYNIIEKGLEGYSMDNSFSDGRMIMGLLNLLVLKLNIPIIAYVIGTLLVAIVLSCVVVILLKNSIERYRKIENKWIEILVLVLSYVTIFNFMYLEQLYFIECIVMAVSLLLYTIGANILVDRKKGYLWKSAFCVISGMLCYQGTVGFFLVLVLLYSIFKNRDRVIYIVRDVILSGGLVVIAGLVNLGCVKVFTTYFHTTQNRLSTNIFENILTILTNISKTLTNTCGMLPKNWLLIFLSITVIIAVITIVEKYKKKSGKQTVLWFILIAFVIASSFASSVLSKSSFWAPRMRFSLGALIGILYLYLYVTTDLFQKKNILKIMAIAVIILYGSCNLYQYITIIHQGKMMNQVEKEECQRIKAHMQEYEEETGIKVTKIGRVFTTSHNRNLYLPNYLNPNTTVFNSTKCWWSAKGVIYFYTGRRLEHVDVGVEEKKILEDSGQEWLCIGDVLYIFIYQT